MSTPGHESLHPEALSQLTGAIPSYLAVLLPLALPGLLALAPLLGTPWWFAALLVPPAMFLAQGWGLALWMNEGRCWTRLELGLTSGWLGIAATLVEVVLVRELGLPPNLLPVMALVVAGLGLLLVRARGALVLPRGGGPGALNGLLGLATVFLAVTALALWRLPDLLRPLDAYWWDSRAESALHEPVSLRMDALSAVGWPEAGALAGELGRGRHQLEVTEAGDLLALARGDVGLDLALGQGQQELDRAELVAAPTVEPEEGPVDRYLDRGIVAVEAHLETGTAWLDLDRDATVYLLPTALAVWSLDHCEVLRFVHYYQILNIVENQRWATEILTHRRLTVSQPPLWSYLMAPQVALASPGLPAASVLFLWVLVFVGAHALHLLEVLAPRAPAMAWLLPGMAMLMQGRLMVDPGSLNFPDNLYTAAILAGLAALLQGTAPRFGFMALVSGLLRYAGTPFLLLLALLSAVRKPGSRGGLLSGAMGPGRALCWGFAVSGITLGFAVVLGLYAGTLQAWMQSISFEILPEHWHGDYDPAVLLSRVPRFYWLWTVYSGGSLLLALFLARGPSRFPLWAALIYSLLLCTIDHFPSHYFLPLVQLAALALAAAPPPPLLLRPGRWAANLPPLLGCLGFLAAILWLPV